MSEEKSSAPLDTIELPLDSVEGLQSFGKGLNSKSEESLQKVSQTEGWCKKFWRWIPTSDLLLEQAEEKILQYIKTPYEGKFVDIGSVLKASKCKWSCKVTEERRIWTLALNKESSKVPLVLVHGLCASAGLWALNLDAFAESRPVYAIDLLGFGRSSRPTFSSNAEETEAQHVESLEAWRQQMNMDRFILLGHSMGGFLSSAYAIKYPERVSHLILADPWGFPQKPENVEEVLPIKKTLTFQVISKIAEKVNPLAVVRVAGPMGPRIIGKARPDLVSKFEALNQDGKGSISEYIFHANAQNPTGEFAFRTMMDFFGWAKNPMAKRIQNLPSEIPMTMIYGEKTWLQQLSELELKNIRPPSSPTTVFTLENAGHHVYADNQPAFNNIVKKIGLGVDNKV